MRDKTPIPHPSLPHLPLIFAANVQKQIDANLAQQ